MFEDRLEAGRLLAAELATYKDRNDAIILALPRGGVEVGFALAERLHLPLDVLITRKLRAPENPEYALGALTETGYRFVNPDVNGLVVGSWGLEYLEKETALQREEIHRRKQLYRRGSDLPDVSHRTVLLVDDGIATGSTVIAAIRGLKTLDPGEVVVAVPVASRQAIEALGDEADRIVVLSVPSRFFAVGEHYRSFAQVEDREVVAYLEAARTARTAGTRRTSSGKE